MTKKLQTDYNRIEDICIETANRRELRYIYYLAVAVLHIFEWIERKERYLNVDSDTVR